MPAVGGDRVWVAARSAASCHRDRRLPPRRPPQRSSERVTRAPAESLLVPTELC